MSLISHSITLTHSDVRLQVLLQELVDQGEIKAGTERKAVYPLVKDNKQCTNILGSPGSGLLESFWNAVGVVDMKPEGKIEIDEGAAERYNKEHQLQVPSDKGHSLRKCLDCRHATQMQYTLQSAPSTPPIPSRRSWFCPMIATTALGCYSR